MIDPVYTEDWIHLYNGNETSLDMRLSQGPDISSVFPSRYFARYEDYDNSKVIFPSYDAQIFSESTQKLTPRFTITSESAGPKPMIRIWELGGLNMERVLS